MSGYAGNGDLESEHALIIAENGIMASRLMLQGRVLTQCASCGDNINIERVRYAIKVKMKCEYCTSCQPQFDKSPKIKMLDRIL